MESIVEFFTKNKTKMFAINGILNTVLLLTYLSIEESRSSSLYHHQPKQNSVPEDFCPIIRLLNNMEKYHSPYFEADMKSSVKLSLCFGPKGPVIQLRNVGGEFNGLGVDLNPYQFRLINKTEIEEQIKYIP